MKIKFDHQQRLLIERTAREAGPWDSNATRRIEQLRAMPERDEVQRFELAVLRQREITECVRLRRERTR